MLGDLLGSGSEHIFKNTTCLMLLIIVMTPLIWKISGSFKIQKINILRRKQNCSMKVKNSELVPQVTHFEKLSFCNEGNFY